MSSLLVTLVCFAISLCVSYQGKGTVLTAKQQVLSNTAQNLHWRRRLQHAACGLVIASGYKWFIRDGATVVAVLCFCCSVFLGLHTLRCRIQRLNAVYLKAFGPLLRPHELNELPGAFWFLLGTAIAVAIFPRHIALQSIIHLSLGDPVASLAGISFGNRNRVLPDGKSLAGFLAAFLACATSTLLLFGWCRDGAAHDQAHLDVGEGLECRLAGDTSVCNGRVSESDSGALYDHDLCMHSSNSLFFSSILGGLSGALGEFLPLRMDDNLSMPIISGALFLILHR